MQEPHSLRTPSLILCGVVLRGTHDRHSPPAAYAAISAGAISLNVTIVLTARWTTASLCAIVYAVTTSCLHSGCTSTLTAGSGRARWTFTLARGVYRLRARFAGTDDLAAAASLAITVRVA